MTDFIEEYRDFILDNVPTGREWAESLAIALLSTVMPNRYISSKLKPLKPNIWFLTIAPSGLAYKSVPLTGYVLPTLATVSKLINKPTILPSRYSIEGMIEYLCRETSWGCIVRDEFTAIFKETEGRGYLRDQIEFMAELYDGTLQKRYTKSSKLEEAIDVYVTLVGATTPYLFKVMKMDWFLMGVGNRLLYLLYTTKPSPNEKRDFFYDWAGLQEKEERFQHFAQILANLYNSRFRVFIPTPEAGELWSEFKIAIDTEAQRRFERDIYDIIYTYLVRMPEMALKLSALKAVSRSYESLPRSELQELLIGVDDMKWAIGKVKWHYEQFEKMLELWRTKPSPREAATLEEQTSLVIEVLRDAKGEGIEWGELRRKTKWEKDVWKEVINYLWETQAICAVLVQKGENKVPVLFAKEYEVDARAKGEPIITWSALAFHLKL